MHQDADQAGGAARTELASHDAPSGPAVFAEYLALTRRRRRELLLTSLAALAAFAIFAWRGYAAIERNFSRERLQANAESLARDLAREATPALLDAAKQSLPAYRVAAEKELRESLPLLRERTFDELALLRERIPEKARQALQQTLDGPLDEAVRDMQASFPSLADAAFRDELRAETERALRTELEALLADAGELYRPHIDRVVRAFQSLERPEDRERSTDELERRFVHHWLMLVDQRVTNGACFETSALDAAASASTEQGG